MDVAHLLNTTVTSQRRQTVPDGRGGQTTSWVDRDDRPARVSQPNGAETVVGDAGEVRVTGYVYLLPDDDTERGDLLGHNGRTLEVIEVVEPSVSSYRRATCTDAQVAP